MNRSPLRSKPTLLAAVVALSLFTSSHTIAQDATCTLSGRVVDTEGNPVAYLPIAVQSVEISNDGVDPTYFLDELEPTLAAYAALPKSQTDEAGRFSITGIKRGPIQFLVQPAAPRYDVRSLPDLDLDTDFGPDAEVLSIEIGAITFHLYDQRQPPWGGITLGIEPGAHLKNVKVTVKPRMRIRGQVVFADGTPLAKALVGINIRRHDFDGTGTGNSGSRPQTDDAGYFVQYVDKPGFYRVVAKFQGLLTTSGRFILEDGQRHDGLVLTFDSEPVPIEATLNQEEPDSLGQWVLNPANNHSYKRVRCDSWDDAQAKAIAEGAHLVAINDAAEQQWLVRIFGTAPYWIGLTDVAKEGEWGWTNGEPATYTNWATHKLTNADRGEEDYVFMGLSPNGRWYKVGPQSPEWQMTRMAILEKEGLPPKPSPEEK
jgi:hypothetical protein